VLRFEIRLKKVDDVGGNRQRGLIAHRHDPVPIMPILKGMMVVIWPTPRRVGERREFMGVCQVATARRTDAATISQACFSHVRVMKF
jgi:hypothetical protein